jgi:hypothetical protein
MAEHMEYLTEAEIAERAAKIREGWSAKERRRRRGKASRPRAGIKVISTSLLPQDCLGEASGWHYLSDQEIEEANHDHNQPSLPENLDEPEETVEFQAVAVDFGD